MPKNTEEAAACRRVGRFWVASTLLNDVLHGSEDTHQMSRIFSLLQFIPLEVKHLHTEGKVEFTGISPRFGIRIKGAPIPFYTIHIHVAEDPVSGRMSVWKVHAHEEPGAPSINPHALDLLTSEFFK